MYHRYICIIYDNSRKINSFFVIGAGDGSTTFNLPTQSVLPLGKQATVKRVSNAAYWYTFVTGTDTRANNSGGSGTYGKIYSVNNGHLGNIYQTGTGFSSQEISLDPNGGLIVDLTQATGAQAIVCIKY